MHIVSCEKKIRFPYKKSLGSLLIQRVFKSSELIFRRNSQLLVYYTHYDCVVRLPTIQKVCQVQHSVIQRVEVNHTVGIMWLFSTGEFPLFESDSQIRELIIFLSQAVGVDAERFVDSPTLVSTTIHYELQRSIAGAQCSCRDRQQPPNTQGEVSGKHFQSVLLTMSFDPLGAVTILSWFTEFVVFSTVTP